VRVTIEATNGQDPAVVKSAVGQRLTQKLALFGAKPRPPGVPVTQRDVAAWIRAVDGVRSVSALSLVPPSGPDTDEIKLPRNGLPRFDLAGSNIEVQRPVPGGAR
jgi:hypothetical protein